MSHYECTNCGAHMGLHWGYCRECTPQEYFDLQNERTEIVTEREHEFNKSHVAEIEAFNNLMRDRRNAYVKLFTEDIDDRLDEIVEEHKNGK